MIIQNVDDLASGIIENVISSKTTSDIESPQNIISSYESTKDFEELDGVYYDYPRDESLNPLWNRCATDIYLYAKSVYGRWLKVSTSKN